jgi:hypothetical protein
MAEKKIWTHKSVEELLRTSESSDPIKIVKEKARELVLAALDKGWQGPPFNALELSQLLNIEVVPNDSVFDARIVPIKHNKFVIEYNPFQKPTRLNFSIAHEIAHTFFPDCAETIHYREENPSENKQLEQLCNIAASEIQLPYAYFSNDANSLEEITIEHLTRLATKYKSSLESLFLRFVEVTDAECAIMICQFSEDLKNVSIEYSKSSKSFKAKIPNSFQMPSDSTVYECVAPGWTTRETANWGFLEGKYDIYYIGLSPLRNSNIPRIGVVIVPNKGTDDLQTQRIQIEFGDATKPRGNGAKIIAQIVNTSGGLGMGFGKSLARNYPIIKKELELWKQNKREFVLGNTNFVNVGNNLWVFQMLAQKGLFAKGDDIPLKYNSLRKCLQELCIVAKDVNASVHMPLIGAGQAKGNWEIISGMIHDELVSNDIYVYIYVLPGKSFPFNKKSSLVEFNEKSTWQRESLF